MRPSVLLIALAAVVSAIPAADPVADADALAAPVMLDASPEEPVEKSQEEIRERLKGWGQRQGGMALKNGYTVTGSQKHPNKAPMSYSRDKNYKAKWRKLGKYRKRPFEESGIPYKKPEQTKRERCHERCKAITGIWPFTMWCKLCKAIYTE